MPCAALAPLSEAHTHTLLCVHNEVQLISSQKMESWCLPGQAKLMATTASFPF